MVPAISAHKLVSFISFCVLRDRMNKQNVLCTNFKCTNRLNLIPLSHSNWKRASKNINLIVSYLDIHFKNKKHREKNQSCKAYRSFFFFNTNIRSNFFELFISSYYTR